MEKLFFYRWEMASLLKIIFKSQSATLFFFTLLLLAISAPVWSDSTNNTGTEKNWNRQRIIPLSSPIYDEMDRSFIFLKKKLFHLHHAPWSADTVPREKTIKI